MELLIVGGGAAVVMSFITAGVLIAERDEKRKAKEAAE